MNTSEYKKKYLSAVAEDDARYGKYGLTHADGTPCDAKTPESCPHNKNAQKADDLSGAEKKDGVVSQSGVKASPEFWDEMESKIREQFPKIPTKEIDMVMDSVISDFNQDDICRFGSSIGSIDERGMFGEYDLEYTVPTEVSPYEHTEKNADGKWVVSRAVSPVWSSKEIDGDLDEHNRGLRSALGVEVRRDNPASEEEMDSDLDFGADGELVGKCSAPLSLFVVDRRRFEDAVMKNIDRNRWRYEEGED